VPLTASLTVQSSEPSTGVPIFYTVCLLLGIVTIHLAAKPLELEWLSLMPAYMLKADDQRDSRPFSRAYPDDPEGL
jgi:hypothetical protein